MAKRSRSIPKHIDMTYMQQGDVLIFCVIDIPPKVTQKADGVLARGEATGHAHRLTDASNGLLYETDDGTLYLSIGPQGATITHEEHLPISLPPGNYRVGQVQEYDHFAEEARQVRD